MPKKFALTLIILSTLVYGTIFIAARYYGTGFLEEMLIQLNRASTNMSSPKEIAQSKLILDYILSNDVPPDNWESLVDHNQKYSHKELFYYYKVWTIKSRLTPKDVAKSYPIFKASQNNITIINMRYGKQKPVLQFPFTQTPDGRLVTGLFYPINSPPIIADFNSDNRVDLEDVNLARKKYKTKG